MLFTKEDINRIEIKEDNGIVTVDLHGLSVTNAKRLINNLIVMNRDPFELDLIHGYNRGTALKQMIHEDLNSNRIVKKEVLAHNLGLTKVQLAKA